MTPIVAILATIDILGIYYNVMLELVVDIELTISICNCTDILLACNPYPNARDRFIGLAIYNRAGDVVKRIKVIDVLVVSRNSIACREEGRGRYLQRSSVLLWLQVRRDQGVLQ